MATKLAPRNTPESIAWLRHERVTGHRYPGQCLILQRSARGIPPLAPTAFSASLMVPAKERTHRIRNYRQGMVGFSKGSNPAGHIFDILGRRKGFDPDDPDGVITESNDVITGELGRIGIVPLSFYHVHWGHNLQFAATWLNGYDFADFNKKPKPVHPTLGKNYEHAIADVKKALAAHRGEDKKLDAALERDIERMQRKLKRFS